MAKELASIKELLSDPHRLADWRTCVVTVGDRKVTATPVQLKRGPAVKLEQRHGARAQTRIVPPDEWPSELAVLLDAGERVHVLSGSGDWHARRTKRGRWLVSRGKPSGAALDGLAAHDRARRHPLSPEEPDTLRLLVATGLFSPEGRLRKPHAAKYRQVQHYLELLRPLPIWTPGRPVRVVDAGCGKAYMSLALTAWARGRGVDVELTGVDANEDVVRTVAGIAEDLGYDARFETATIWDYARGHERVGVELLVSLHACDTATDEALAAGIILGAEAIVLAPCCHHELVEQLAAGDGWSSTVFRHGLLRGRFADLLTDSLRAAALDVFGYRAEVIEFVAAEHTAKNVMIRAVRRRPGASADRARAAALASYDELASRWRVEPTLRRLLADRWPPARASA
jgi:hypothetical protein